MVNFTDSIHLLHIRVFNHMWLCEILALLDIISSYLYQVTFILDAYMKLTRDVQARKCLDAWKAGSVFDFSIPS